MKEEEKQEEEIRQEDQCKFRLDVAIENWISDGVMRRRRRRRFALEKKKF